MLFFLRTAADPAALAPERGNAYSPEIQAGPELHPFRRFFSGVAIPIVVFSIAYLGVLFLAVVFLPEAPEPVFHTVSLLGALAATWLANRICDRGSWQIGFGGGARNAARESLYGLFFGLAVIAATDALILGSSRFAHVSGDRFDWMIILTLFLPAGIHEEVLFRGYPFQKILAWNRAVAVYGCSALFALAHLGNRGVTPLAALNIFLAGVLLSLAYLLYRRLWFPIALHIGWNVLSGPILGHEVSGYILQHTLLLQRDPGPAVLTGGSFGLEGSVWATLVEVIAIAILLRGTAKRERRLANAIPAGAEKTPAAATTHPSNVLESE